MPSTAEQPVAAADVPANTDAPAPAARTPRAKKTKSTFMLHSPPTMSCKGKFVAADYRYAALKVASRGVADIYLRKTNSREVRVFKGSIVPLDTPKEIRRGDRTITYHNKPVVKYVRKFVFDGTPPDEETVEETAATT